MSPMMANGLARDRQRPGSDAGAQYRITRTMLTTGRATTMAWFDREA